MSCDSICVNLPKLVKQLVGICSTARPSLNKSHESQRWDLVLAIQQNMYVEGVSILAVVVNGFDGSAGEGDEDETIAGEFVYDDPSIALVAVDETGMLRRLVHYGIDTCKVFRAVDPLRIDNLEWGGPDRGKR